MSNKLPELTRARGYHLYGVRRNRILDMFQNGGRAILGHRSQRISEELKAVFSRGLWAEYPSIYGHRAERTLDRFKAQFAGASHDARIFRNFDRALAVATQWRGRPMEFHEPFDPALPAGFVDGAGGPQNGRMVLWRPLCDPPAAPGAGDIIFPVLPFPGQWSPAVVLFPQNAPTPVPASDVVAAPLLAALIRSIHEMAKLTAPRVPNGNGPLLPPLWIRNGQYIIPTCSETRYPEVYARFLSQGILLNPAFPGPSILPIIWSEGEQKLFLRISRSLIKELPGYES
jgi:hypothetical protein